MVLAGIALLPALLVRGCVIDVFQIRSSSMEPLLRGSETDGDRLLVLRAAVDPRPMRRYDLAVFDGAIDPTMPRELGAVIKRVAGLPGEWIALVDGDLHAGPEPAPPRAARDEARIADMLVTMHHGEGLSSPWRWLGPGTSELLEPAGVRLSASEGRRAEARYEASIDDGLPGQAGEVAVNDTALAVRVGDCRGVLELELREGSDVFRARLAPAESGGATLHHNLGGGVVAAAPDFAGLRRGQRVLFWNVDDGLRLFVDERLLLGRDVPADATQPPGAPLRNEPALAVEDGDVELLEVEVLRDVHYVARGGLAHDPIRGVRVPPGHVLLLGDFAARSRDGRDYGPAPLSAWRGRPLAIWSPRDRARWLPADGGRVRGGD